MDKIFIIIWMIAWPFNLLLIRFDFELDGIKLDFYKDILFILFVSFVMGPPGTIAFLYIIMPKIKRERKKQK